MSEDVVPDPVGVVGEHPGVTEAVAAAGGRSLVGDAEDVLAGDPGAVVAVGEPAVLALARAGVDVPVLPVGAGRGVRSVPGEAAPRAVERLLAGEWTAVEHPVLVARPAGVRALMDLMLVTAEPARISEFTVRAGDEPVASFRADGVVVATPAGSAGYAGAAGGPVVAPGTGVVAVVPVAPFATDADHWVLPPGEVALTVARDDAPVELLADDRTVGEVDPGVPVTLPRDGVVTVAVVAGSRPFYSGG